MCRSCSSWGYLIRIHFFVSLAPRHRYIVWFYITRSSFALILILLVNRKISLEGRNRRNTQPVCSGIVKGHLAFKCTYMWNICMRDPIQRHCSLYNYRPQRSWGKIIFSQASVILLTGGGVPAPGGCLLQGGLLWGWVTAPGGLLLGASLVE